MSVNFSVLRLCPHLPGEKWPFVYSNHVLYRFLAFWPSCSLTGYAVVQAVSTRRFVALAILSAILIDTIRLELFRGSCYGDSVMTFFYKFVHGPLQKTK